jgi:hypothetical protein
LHSPPNGASFDVLLPKCGPDVTVPQLESRNSAFEGDFYLFLHHNFRNFQSFLAQPVGKIAAALALASGHFRPAAWPKAGFNADLVDFGARRRPPIDDQKAWPILGLSPSSTNKELASKPVRVPVSAVTTSSIAGRIWPSRPALGSVIGWPSLSRAQPLAHRQKRRRLWPRHRLLDGEAQTGIVQHRGQQCFRSTRCR